MNGLMGLKLRYNTGKLVEPMKKCICKILIKYSIGILKQTIIIYQCNGAIS